MKFNIFPWDNGEKPYWVNPENGIEWYIDKSTTDWCTRETPSDLKKLDAVVFFVAKRDGDEVKPIERVLIDRKSNNPLAAETSLEALAVKIDMIRLTMTMK